MFKRVGKTTLVVVERCLLGSGEVLFRRRRGLTQSISRVAATARCGSDNLRVVWVT